MTTRPAREYSVQPAWRPLIVVALVLTAFLSGAVVLSGSASAATLGAVQLTFPGAPNGTDGTQISGSVTANCPTTTDEAQFIVTGPSTIGPFQDPNSTTGVGTFSFDGFSLANFKSANGGFATTATYLLRFVCLDYEATATASSDVFEDYVITDSYDAAISYTAGANTFTYAATLAPTTTTTSATATTTTAPASATTTSTTRTGTTSSSTAGATTSTTARASTTTASTTAAGRSLASTGGGTVALVLIGSALILVGFLVVTTVRRGGGPGLGRRQA